MKGVWGFPKNQNGRIGCKAETLIFSVCTDTGCACCSPKSHISRHNALPLSIHLKMALTTKEAAEYSNIGINKIDSRLFGKNSLRGKRLSVIIMLLQ